MNKPSFEAVERLMALGPCCHRDSQTSHSLPGLDAR